MTGSVVLKNNAVYCCCLVKCREPQEGMPFMPELQHQTSQLAVGAREWIRENTRITPPSLPSVNPEVKITPLNSQRIDGFKWTTKSDEALRVSLDVRMFPESSYMLLGLWKPGWGEQGDIFELYNKLSNFTSQKVRLSNDPEDLQIAEVYCMYAETTSQSSIPHVCKNILDGFIDEVDDRIALCEFPWGTVAMPKEQKTPLLIIRRADTPGTEDASRFMNIVLPRLMLLSHKIMLHYQAYEKEKEKVKEIAERLAKTLKGRERGGNLHRLEERIKEISSQVDELAEELGSLKKRLLRMDTDLRHIRLKLQDPVLLRKKKVIEQVFGESSALLVEQVRTDIEYFQTQNEEALLTLQSLQAFVGVEQAKLQREQAGKQGRIAAIVGIVGLVLALIDGFADVFSPGNRVLIVFGGIIFGVVIWFWDRWKKKNGPES